MAFGRYEMGLNMVTNDRVILLTSGDPGTPIGQGSQAVTSRLGYVGLGTPVGNFSWGKQWSPYYDVAGFSDQLQVFTGLATGAFGAGTDGGIAGTGRAEQALQYRHSWGPFSGGLQAQNRSLTTNDRQWGDTFGGALVVSGENGFGVGAAYNQVRDGVASPTINEPQLGDKATIFGVRFRHERFYAGSTYSILKQHEIDDLGRRFDGNGFEIALRHYLLEHVWLEGVYNDLRPNDDHPGDFRIRFGAANVVYNFSTASRVFAGFKFEGSRKSDGSDLQTSTFAAGLNYTF
jgi:predicted porin